MLEDVRGHKATSFQSNVSRQNDFPMQPWAFGTLKNQTSSPIRLQALSNGLPKTNKQTKLNWKNKNRAIDISDLRMWNSTALSQAVLF